MKGTRWSETRDALLEIAEEALRRDSGGIDIRFLNSPLVYHGIKVSFNLSFCFRFQVLIYASYSGRRYDHVDIRSGGAFRSAYHLEFRWNLKYVVGKTPTGATLDRVLDDYMSKLDATVNTPQYHDLEPLDIVVLTDGVPSTFIYSYHGQLPREILQPMNQRKF
jgi:hypothetical protein